MTKKNAGAGGLGIMLLILGYIFFEKIDDLVSKTLFEGDRYFQNEINPFEMNSNVSATILEIKKEWVLYEVREPKLPSMTASNSEFVVYTNSTKQNSFKTNYPYFYENIKRKVSK